MYHLQHAIRNNRMDLQKFKYIISKCGTTQLSEQTRLEKA